MTRERRQAFAHEMAGRVAVIALLREARLKEGSLRAGQRRVRDKEVETVFVVRVDKSLQQQAVPLAQRLSTPLARVAEPPAAGRPARSSPVQRSQVLVGKRPPRVGHG